MTTSTGYGTVDPTLEVHCGTAAEACASLCSRAWPRALGFTAAVVGAVLLLTQLPSAAPAAPAALSHLPPHGVPTTTTRTTAATEPVPHPLTPVARRAILQGLVGGLVATAQPMAAMARKAPLARPELLPPGPPQDVIDTQGLLTPSQLKEVHQIIEDCLRMYGVKVRVVTARYPETPGGAIEDYWRPDADTVVVVADSTFPNFLQFNSGDRVEALTRRPFRRFWIKLQSDYGTLRFVRRAGEDQALLLALRAMRDGLSSPDAADAA